MDGPTLLTRCTMECAPQDADRMTADMVAGIEPWTQTLRCLCVVQRLRTELAAVTSLRSDAEDAARWMDEEQAADVADRLAAYATASEAAQTRDGVPLAELVTARLHAQITTGLRKALAVAPDPATHPLHPAWEQPAPGTAGLPRDSMAQTVARDLLTAWAQLRDLRDPLITWAVHGAGLKQTEVNATTRVSRSTIARLLP